jgi:hypothetical protein
LRIVADPATNSLIVYGTAQEFLNIKNILKELDAIPRQVLLEVLVAEVTLSDNQSLGVDYQILGRNAATIFGQKFGSAGAIRTLGDAFPSSSGFGNGVSGVFGGKDIKAQPGIQFVVRNLLCHGFFRRRGDRGSRGWRGGTGASHVPEIIDHHQNGDRHQRNHDAHLRLVFRPYLQLIVLSSMS